MSKSESPATSELAYYECTPCGYTAREDLSIGLCPRCGDDLVATPRIE